MLVFFGLGFVLLVLVAHHLLEVFLPAVLELLRQFDQHFGGLVLEPVIGVVQELKHLLLVVQVMFEPLEVFLRLAVVGDVEVVLVHLRNCVRHVLELELGQAIVPVPHLVTHLLSLLDLKQDLVLLGGVRVAAVLHGCEIVGVLHEVGDELAGVMRVDLVVYHLGVGLARKRMLVVQLVGRLSLGQHVFRR